MKKHQKHASTVTLQRYRPASDIRGRASGISTDSQRSRVLNTGRSEIKSSLRDVKPGKECECTIGEDDRLLLGWELYKPSLCYTNSNESTKSSSAAAYRKLLTDAEKGRIDKPHKRTVLVRLIEMLKTPPPQPGYSYGNCLQQTLKFDENESKYKFKGSLKYTFPDIDEIYLEKKPVLSSRRRNPFAEIQMCPTTLYKLQQQPPGQEYVKRRTGLLDPKNIWYLED